MNLESEGYKAYMKDQIAETLGAGPDDKYLTHLIEDILPNFDYYNTKIIDVGAGKFDSYSFFKEKYNNIIIGIDISTASLEKSKKEGTGLLNVDAHKICEIFKENTFDLLYSSHSLEHMFDLPLAIKNCYKVLKNGGYFYFSLPIPCYNWKHGHWYNVNDISTMVKYCTDAGFAMIHSEYSVDGKYRADHEMIALCRK